MYRQLQRQSSLTQIYCSNEQWCDLNCGKFHTRPQHFQHSQVRQLVGAIEMAAFSGANKEHPKLTIQTKFGGAVSAAELQLSPLTSLLHNGANLSLALPPVSPYPASPGSQTSNLSTASMVTLDDIIASARRKISGDFKEIRLPSPEYEEDDSSMWDKRAARKKLVFHASSLDIPAMEQPQGGGGDSPREGNQYEDQESELQAELFIQEEPPLFFGDEESEDFEEQIKASKPPMDAFSNPILLQDSDPLTMRKKRRQRNLLRQQSKSHLASPSRIHQLGSLSRVVDSGSNAISQRSTPSGQQTGGEEDLGDNSSIDMSMAELSAAVAQGKSPSGSNGPSPSNILQFIEEQKQKGAVTVGIGSSEL